MKHFLYTLLFAVFLVGCSDNKPTMHVYNWSDYIDPELIQEFEQQNNCHIVIDTFDDNESMLAKLMAGASGYDVVFPSSYVIPVMVRNNLIETLDRSKLPNVFGNYDHKYDAHVHAYTLIQSVPYAFSITGIAYRNDVVGSLSDSWDALLDKKLMGRVSLLRDMREMIGIGLKKNGYSLNSRKIQELDAALTYIRQLKAGAAKLDNEQYRTGLVSKEFYACVGYSGDIIQLVSEGQCEHISFIIPGEGSSCCWDEIVIPKTAVNKDLAYKFINFLYDAKNAARNTEYICTAIPNKNCIQYLSDKFKSNPLICVTPEVLDRLELVQDLGDDIELYNKRWDAFTTNRD